MTTQPFVRLADLDFPADAALVLELLDAYSRDPFGDSKPLDDDVRERLIDGLRAHPTTLVFLALDGPSEDAEPLGIATTFVGFSTFAARPLINLHDVSVLPAARGRGVGRALLAAVETAARERGCCRLTLEVLDRNERAKGLYQSFGFRRSPQDKDADKTLFYAKPLR